MNGYFVKEKIIFVLIFKKVIDRIRKGLEKGKLND